VERAPDGVLEESTTVRHAIGTTNAPVVLGTIRIGHGVTLIARLGEVVPRGTRVELHEVDGAPHARRPDAVGPDHIEHEVTT
jgi:hypothetical protein